MKKPLERRASGYTNSNSALEQFPDSREVTKIVLEHFRNTRRLFRSCERWFFLKKKAT
jgi:hypothetical protein